MANSQRCIMVLLLVVLLHLLVTPSLAQIVRPPITREMFDYRCENLTDIDICREIYPLASFPNFRGHQTQALASGELSNFLPLIREVCSNAIVHFLCSIYAPFCQVNLEHIRVRPCRELCEYVRSTCEQPLIGFGLSWPPDLDCTNFRPNASTLVDFCPGDLPNIKIPSNVETVPRPSTSTPSTGNSTDAITSSRTTVLSTTSPRTSSPIGPSVTQPVGQGSMCPASFNVSTNLQGRDYVFGGVENCGINCTGVYFSALERNILAPIFILLFAILCVLFTLFTVATFLIDRRRFHYPERPIIFLSFCYLVVSIIYIVGAISKLVGNKSQAFSCSDVNFQPNERISSSFVMQRLPNSESTYKSASCVILFVVVYFFHMASGMWWIILTLTWFLAAALKWGEEAVEKFWFLYHIVAWGIPALQVILVLALRLVDGDQLSGICYTGNYDNVGLGVFVFLPLTSYLLIGIVFLVIGFSALINIKNQLQRDIAKSRKIGRLILRVGVYSALYIIPNIVLLILLLYELAQKNVWERSYLDECLLSGISTQCYGRVTPSFAAFLLKYIMLFLVGINSTSWIFTSKTFAAWQKLFCSCCATAAKPSEYDIPPQHHYEIPSPAQQYRMPEKHGIPNPSQQYIIPEKYGDLSSLQMAHPHTAV